MSNARRAWGVRGEPFDPDIGDVAYESDDKQLAALCDLHWPEDTELALMLYTAGWRTAHGEVLDTGNTSVWRQIYAPNSVRKHEMSTSVWTMLKALESTE